MATFLEVVTVNVNIALEDVPEDAYRKIREYIQSVLDEGKAPKLGKVCYDPKRSMKPSQTMRRPEPADKYANVFRYKNRDDVIAIFKDAEKNPDRYTHEWRNTKVWMQECESLRGASVHGVSHVLGSMSANGLVEKNARYNDEIHEHETLFRVPVPAAVEKKEKADTFGARLKKLMQEHGLNLQDMQDLIGYDADTIKKWISGIYTVSSEARQKLEEVFGKKCFEEAKAV